MSAEPQDLLSLALIVAALISLAGCVTLYVGKRKVRRSFPRTTMLFMGLALTQLAGIAEAQTEPRKMMQVALIGAFLFVLAVGAYVEARRVNLEAAT